MIEDPSDALAPRGELPIGLIAGNGNFPVEFARNAKGAGRRVVAVAHRGETPPELEHHVEECTWIRVGELGKGLRALRRARVAQAAFVGGITKASVLGGGIRPDLRGILALFRIRSFKDDVLLRGLAREVEREGIEIISSSLYLRESIATHGYLTSRRLTKRELLDAELGWDVALMSGRFDIGQAVIVQSGVVVAVEAVEGTDAAIERAGALAGRKGGVIVKLPKPQQDLRFDMPAVGPVTLENMAKAGLTALVLKVGGAHLHEPQEMIEMAESLGIAIVSVEEPSLLHQLD